MKIDIYSLEKVVSGFVEMRNKENSFTINISDHGLTSNTINILNNNNNMKLRRSIQKILLSRNIFLYMREFFRTKKHKLKKAN